MDDGPAPDTSDVDAARAHLLALLDRLPDAALVALWRFLGWIWGPGARSDETVDEQ